MIPKTTWYDPKNNIIWSQKYFGIMSCYFRDHMLFWDRVMLFLGSCHVIFGIMSCYFGIISCYFWDHVILFNMTWSQKPHDMIQKTTWHDPQNNMKWSQKQHDMIPILISFYFWDHFMLFLGSCHVIFGIMPCYFGIISCYFWDHVMLFWDHVMLFWGHDMIP
jgi:hypothetical protein